MLGKTLYFYLPKKYFLLMSYLNPFSLNIVLKIVKFINKFNIIFYNKIYKSFIKNDIKKISLF